MSAGDLDAEELAEYLYEGRHPPPRPSFAPTWAKMSDVCRFFYRQEADYILKWVKAKMTVAP